MQGYELMLIAVDSVNNAGSPEVPTQAQGSVDPHLPVTKRLHEFAQKRTNERNSWNWL